MTVANRGRELAQSCPERMWTPLHAGRPVGELQLLRQHQQHPGRSTQLGVSKDSVSSVHSQSDDPTETRSPPHRGPTGHRETNAWSATDRSTA